MPRWRRRRCPSPSSSRWPPAWCRSRRRACCRRSRIPRLRHGALRRGSGTTAPLEPRSRRPPLRARLHRVFIVLVAVASAVSFALREHLDLLTRIGGAVVVVLALVFLASVPGSGCSAPRFRGGSRPPDSPARPCSARPSHSGGTLHRVPRWPPSSRPHGAAQRRQRGRRSRSRPRGRLLARPRGPLRPDRRGVLEGQPHRHLAASPPPRDPRVRRGPCSSRVGVLMVSGVWTDLVAWVQTHLVGGFTTVL
jgi:cytochrome c-type biogenesis protein